jgi:transketolase
MAHQYRVEGERVVTEQVQELEQIAHDLRCLVVQMVYRAGSGHIGGSLSAADLITALYFSVLRIDPQRPDWPDRDRFVLSKGHAAPIVYAALARRGFFPLEELWTLRQIGSRLQGHPDRLKTPGIDATTGSLGQGISVASGMALAAKLNGQSLRVYAMVGCGECQEGQVWEAAMSGSHYQLDNLTVIQDYNGRQIDGTDEEVMTITPLAEKWRALGWRVLEIDGHDMKQILEGLAAAQEGRGRPTVIVARTVKGKGVSFMENQAKWHSGAPSQTEFERAMADLYCGVGA